MRIWDYITGLLSDIVSSLGAVLIVLAIAFVVALAAGWVDLSDMLGWIRDLAP